MEPRLIDLKPKSFIDRASTKSERLSVMAGPMIWYAFAGLAIILSGYLFLFGSDADNGHQHAIGMFIGLWAPMFGILGLRAEIAEMRDDLSRRRGRG